MLGDIKSSIISFVNEALKASFSTAQLETAIQSCLDDLSKLDALVSTDSSQTLAVNDEYLAYPSNFRSIVSIVLINSSGIRQAPLEELPEGHIQYRELRDNDSATGVPEWFSEYNNKFWLWRPANGAFTTEIECYINHPSGQTANILFGDDFKQAIQFGSTYFKALFSKRNTDIANWKPIYEEERAKMALEVVHQPHITRG